MGTRIGQRAFGITAAAGAVLIACAAATAAGFPDVPPWHCGALIDNAITQVYDGFAHASAAGAQAWVERFSYNLPPDWPAPFLRSEIVAFSLTGMRVSINGNTAEAAFTAAVGTRGGRTSTVQMHVAVRFNGLDWRLDYAALARASPLFR
ncbi:MAG: hypothetical protein E6H04_05875 [Bacillati bacterium ANGP1]|uniref:Nuclear transport factor 2 family protein n=1 Tax=Candidatus Segetimicrobium genomatis TaxID=2569760 RepID=A0A537JED5_9BACT|nr:MAG: hypothetical protein E6H04_05875 [Terrabacteria group bacterium ANGP1]